MSRYFLEVIYKGTNYSGFQIQQNANTIQAEIEKAFALVHRKPVFLTGSSRTDAGVHALQNYYHFDATDVNPQILYKLNAVLPADIVIRNIYKMHPEAHARFDAIARQYEYRIHQSKNPFLRDRSFYYPYKIDADLLHQAAAIVKDQTFFFAFAKTNTQVANFNCTILQSQWHVADEQLIYTIKANRFLRGMVRLLTASLIKVGRGKISLQQFKDFFLLDAKCGYSVPAHGLFLKTVQYPVDYFVATDLSFTSILK